MPGDFDLDFEMQDSEVRSERPKRPVQQQSQQQRAPQQGRGAQQTRPQSRPPQRGGAAMARRKKNQTTSIIILSVEVVVFIALVCLFFVLKSKIDKSDSSAAGEQTTASGETSDGGATSNGVNVESSEFSLTCSRVNLAKDNDDNPVALIFFTFVNKTDNALSMSAVFPPSLTQNGAACADATNIADSPAEIANRDTAVSGGQSIECCYGFVLQDLTSPITLTIHDNYSTFTDIGSTTINLQ